MPGLTTPPKTNTSNNAGWRNTKLAKRTVPWALMRRTTSRRTSLNSLPSTLIVPTYGISIS
jgi:hypothetical protein